MRNGRAIPAGGGGRRTRAAVVCCAALAVPAAARAQATEATASAEVHSPADPATPAAATPAAATPAATAPAMEAGTSAGAAPSVDTLHANAPSAAPSASARSASPAPIAVSRTALWLQPVLPSLSWIGQWYQFSAGLSRSLTRGLDLTVEGAIGYVGGYTNAPTGSASVGLTFLLTGDRPMNGLFLTPKLQFSGGPQSLNSSALGGDAFGVGLDVGYQATIGALYLAAVVGVGYDLYASTRASTPVVYAAGLNVALFRIGWVFDRPQEPAARARGGFDLATDRRPRRFALYALPVWWALGPLLNRYDVTLGAAVPFERWAQVVAEAGVEWGRGPDFATSARVQHTIVHGAVGVAFLPWTNGPLHGFFLEPRVVAARSFADASMGGSDTVTIGAQLEAGFQYTFGPLYFGPVLGLGVGYTSVLGGSAERAGGFVPTYDLSLLRLGAAL